MPVWDERDVDLTALEAERFHLGGRRFGVAEVEDRHPADMHHKAEILDRWVSIATVMKVQGFDLDARDLDNRGLPLRRADRLGPVGHLLE